MHSPYTHEPLEAYMAAQAAVATTLTAILWHKPINRVATTCLLLAIWLATLAPVEGIFFSGLGFQLVPNTARAMFVLRFACLVAAGGAIVSKRLPLVLVAAFGGAFLYWATTYIVDSDLEMCAAHLAFFGLLVGIAVREKSLPAPDGVRAASPSFAMDDAILFAMSVVLSAIVATYVLERGTDSADEWSYTYQAAAFARGHAYARASPCWPAFQSFWVFEAGGRSFSQYTPGWPLFMAPFMLFGVGWLAGPASLGLFVIGAARVARRAASGYSRGSQPPPPAQVRAAGWFAGLATTLSTTLLINGGSRFPHVFVCATFVWALEWLCEATSGDISHAKQWRAGILCGACAMMTVATRPPDGATLGFGLFVYAAYALARRKLPLRVIGGTLAAFAVVGGLTLVILRLQLGKWFTTGYSLNEVFHPWNKFGISLPEKNEVKAALPLASGAYCWWPCSPAIGMAGLAMLHGRARRIAVILFFSTLSFVVLYEMIEFGRHFDFGYGPRFQLPLVVPMAIGTGAALAPLWQSARAHVTSRSALRAGGPIAVVMCAAIVALVRIAPLLYPYAHASVMAHEHLRESIKPLRLKNAVVLGGVGLTTADARDVTENLPLDIYPDQDVLIANDFTPSLRHCVEATYPRRKFYKAHPGNPITLEQLPPP